MRKQLFILFSLMTLVMSCKSLKSSDETNEIEFKLIAQDNLYGNGSEGLEEGVKIIDSIEQWTKLLDQLNMTNTISEPFIATNVDFDNYIIIAAFDAIQPTSGFYIDLKLQKEQNDVVINTLHRNPQGVALTVLTQPYIIVMIQKTSGRIVIK